MHALRTRFLIGTIYVTAAMTLVAGLPHLECRCRGDQLQRISLALLSLTTGCRCVDTRPAPRQVKACCRSQAETVCWEDPQPREQASASAASGATISQPSCTKVVVSPEVFV